MMHDDIQRTDPRLLVKFLAKPEENDAWAAADLAAMVRHQLAAPLASDLEAAFPGCGQRVAALATSMGVVSFSDLLAAASPPVELLRLVKDMAKASAEGVGALPKEVASYFYFASIAAAWRHAGTRISTLSDDRLREGFAWLLQQAWVEAGPRQLLEALQERR